MKVNNETKNMSFKIDLKNISEEGFKKFQNGFSDFVDSLGINADVNWLIDNKNLNEMIISSLASKLDEKYLIDDICSYIENSEKDKFLDLTINEWKNIDIHNEKIDAVLSHIAKKRDEWRMDSMSIDDVLYEYENNYSDKKEIKNIKKAINNTKQKNNCKK